MTAMLYSHLTLLDSARNYTIFLLLASLLRREIDSVNVYQHPGNREHLEEYDNELLEDPSHVLIES